MESNIPKVLHKIDGIPMINHILLKVKQMSETIHIAKVYVVVGKYKDEIKESIEQFVDLPQLSYIYQDEPLGTGHAIQCCMNELLRYPNADVLILSGDVPLLSINTMLSLLNMSSDVKLITATIEDPTGYGRIVVENNKFVKIVEQKDCDRLQLDITKVNTGIYCIKAELLTFYLPYLKNDNKQNEYYLTDIIEIIKKRENTNVEMLDIEKEKIIEIIGVNTISQLKELEILIKKLK